ncbi:MAG: rhodanese-like domain-containing protein [Nitrospirota bacterium]|nr:rhodanese-like domain-containing protein [Nitrospirota bacterium]
MNDLSVLFGGTDISLSCGEMKKWLDREGGDGDCFLLDVREEWEHRFVRFPGSLNIPLSRLPENLWRISSDGLVIVYCHTGIRSLLACYLLSKNGFSKIRNLEGGIDAYALKVDARLPRYRLDPGRRPPESVLDANARGSLRPDQSPWGEGVTETISPDRSPTDP